MKSIMVYSGKGGVGKTTTSANIAKALAESGKKVYLLDGDINTPSIPVIFPTQNPIENLWTGSTGYQHQGFIFLEKSMVRKFLSACIKDINDIRPDFVIIDTPPSITDVHINLIQKLEISGILMVTQPTDLSKSDVVRTGAFFSNRNIPVVGIVENMATSLPGDYMWKLLASIPFEEKFNGQAAYQKYQDRYAAVAAQFNKLDDVILENKKRMLFDESMQVEDLIRDLHARGIVSISGELLEFPHASKFKFFNLSTWKWVREKMMEADIMGQRDRLIDDSTYERVARLVKAFEGDDSSLFMITNAPNTEIFLIPGEIGQGSLKISDKHYGLPCVNYHTKNGDVMLFPHEVKPMDEHELSIFLAEGYSIISDGRYIPTKQHCEQVYNAFGSRVGISDGWEEKWDMLMAGDLKKTQISI